MTEENELARLEGFVSTLLEKFNGLQGDNQELTERLQRRDASIASLEDELAGMKDDRSEVSTRVSSLIGQIEEWETNSGVEVDSQESEEDAEEDERNDSGVQGNLFDTEAENE